MTLLKLKCLEASYLSRAAVGGKRRGLPNALMLFMFTSKMSTEVQKRDDESCQAFIPVGVEWEI